MGITNLPFPSIPAVTTNQVASAATLTSYGEGLNYLLGESHSPFALLRGTGVIQTYRSNYEQLATYYLYYAGFNALYYMIDVYLQSGYNYTGTLYLVDNVTGAETSILDLTGAGTSAWVRLAGTADISALSLDNGNVYELRFKAHTNDISESKYVQWKIWVLELRPEISSVWITPPAFVDGLSDPSHVNAIRTDLLNLANRMISPIHSLYYYGPGEFNTQSHNWAEVTGSMMHWRYRPTGIQVQIQARTMYVAEMQWRVVDEAGTVLWTSTARRGSDYEYFWEISDEIPLPGYTFGNWYNVKLQVRVHPGDGSDPSWYADSDHPVYVRVIIPRRVSDGTPAAGWEVPPTWAHGDTTLRADKLNKLSTDITMLYSGNETLWGSTPAVLWQGSGTHHIYAGLRRRRYLVYMTLSGLDAKLHYGTDFGTEYSLSTKDGAWQTYDLSDANVSWGTAYYVEGVKVAFECDHPIW